MNDLISHDRFFRESMSNIAIARSFFEAHLPATLLSMLDLTTLRLQKESFVDKAHQQKNTDVLYSANVNGKQGYLYLHAEHQSHPEKLMPFRMLKYLCGIFDMHLKQQKKKEAKTLPIVIPLVMYHGRQSPYPYSTDIIDCFAQPELARELCFKPFKLIDLTIIPDETLHQHQHAAFMELVQKHIYLRDLAHTLRTFLTQGHIQKFRELGSGEYIEFALHYILKKSDIPVNEFFDLILHELPEEQENIMTLAQRLKQEGRQEGFEAGKQAAKQTLHQSAINIAKNLLMRGMNANEVASITNLSIQEVKMLQTELK